MSALPWLARATILLWLTTLSVAPVPVKTTAAGLINTDEELLLAFKATFSNGARLGSWKRGTNPCRWNRVKCSGGRVTELLLEDKGLRGSIPLQGWALPSTLRVLDMDGCALWGTIPPGFKLPEGLRKLELDHNSLSGSLPADWQLPPQLRELHLYANKLSGTLPPNWRLPATLRSIGLNGNNFSGPLPAWPSIPEAEVGVFPGNEGLCGEVPAGPHYLLFTPKGRSKPVRPLPRCPLPPDKPTGLELPHMGDSTPKRLLLGREATRGRGHTIQWAAAMLLLVVLLAAARGWDGLG